MLSIYLINFDESRTSQSSRGIESLELGDYHGKIADNAHNVVEISNRLQCLNDMQSAPALSSNDNIKLMWKMLITII